MLKWFLFFYSIDLTAFQRCTSSNVNQWYIVYMQYSVIIDTIIYLVDVVTTRWYLTQITITLSLSMLSISEGALLIKYNG